LKTELDSKVKKTVIGVKEDVEETLEIERRKLNLVIHGVPEVDAEHDIGAISDILGTGLHMEFDRHVASVMRIGKLDENRRRPIRLIIKSMDGKKQILPRAKDLKEVAEYKRMFISPDLTRKQQAADKVLRTQLNSIRATEATAKIKYGKIVKNGTGGRWVVLFDLEQQN